MTNLTMIKQETDVKETLEGFLKVADQIEGLVIVGLNKDGSQFLHTTTMNGYKKAFLCSFHQSCMNDWFNKVTE